MTRSLLVEILVEELPAKWLPGVLDSFREAMDARIASARISCGEVRALGTMRRLAVVAERLTDKADDWEGEVRGPAANVAFDAEGAPTRAAVGFASSHGLTPDQLIVKDTAQGRYVFARVVKPGRLTIELLPDIIVKAVLGVEFPVSMRWGAYEFRYGRPIRNLVALYGEEVVPVVISELGLRSSAETYGHRSSGKVAIPSAEGYEDALLQAKAIVDPDKRRQCIAQAVADCAASVGAVPLWPAGLLDELTWMIEYGQAVCGRFDDKYLDLPAKLLETVMAAYQRYVPLVREGAGEQDQAASGRRRGLVPAFVSVIGGGFARPEGVAHGNERVLRARLDDAEFFFGHDRQRTLEELLGALDRVVFYERAGTLGDRARRLEALSRRLAEQLGEDGEAAARAGLLAKADLASLVVTEMPELAGTIGKILAGAHGEPPAVADAIGEHAWPRYAGDRLPTTALGRIVAVADRTDALVALSRVGVQASGSQDPYGLRRMAAAIVGICDAGPMPVPIETLIDLAIDNSSGIDGEVPSEQVRERALELVRARVRAALEDRGFRHDVIEAVLAQRLGSLPQAVSRARAVTELLASTLLDDVLTCYRRSAHLAGEGAGPVDPTKFESPVERELYEECQQAFPTIDEATQAGHYRSALAAIAGLRPAVDRFFDGVLVMAPDPGVRENRLNLLRGIAGRCTSIADFGRLVIG